MLAKCSNCYQEIYPIRVRHPPDSNHFSHWPQSAQNEHDWERKLACGAGLRLWIGQFFYAGGMSQLAIVTKRFIPSACDTLLTSTILRISPQSSSDEHKWEHLACGAGPRLWSRHFFYAGGCHRSGQFFLCRGTSRVSACSLLAAKPPAHDRYK